MYRILLVDSNKDSREYLVNLIKSFDFDVVVQAVSSGQAALEFAANNCIDVLVTEINMEDIDGFQLVDELKQINDRLRFIIVSDSEEFSDVKKAIKLGACDYIKKPLEKNEFYEAITNALEQCQEIAFVNDQNEMNNEFVKEHVILSLLYGKKIEDIKIDDEHISSREEYDTFRRLVLIEFDRDFFNKVSEDFEKSFNEYLEQIGIYGHYINLNSVQSVLLLNETLCNDIEYERLVEACEKIKNKLSIGYAKKCFVALSSEIYNCNELIKALEETEELMEGKFYEVESKVFIRQEKEESPIFVQQDDDTLIKQIRQDIKLKDIESLKSDFEKLWIKYGSKTNLSQIYIKFVFSNILKEFYDALPNLSEIDLNNEVDKLYRTTGLSAVKEIINANIQRLEENFNINPQTIHREVECVKQYIYNNFKEEIGVEQLAEMVYMAPSYLSCVFKKETGQNLSKFIKSVRMEKAKEMLDKTHMKIVNISTEVGYPNVSYFCQSFREYYGISPQKFRAGGETIE